MNTAVYGVVRDDTGAVPINPGYFEFEDVLEGGGRRGRVQTHEKCRKREKGCVGFDAGKYLEMSEQG